VGDRWSITPSGSGLKDGRHSFVLVTTDELGRVTGSSNPLSVMIDSIAPSAPSVTGLLSTSGLLGSLVSSLTQPLLGGLAEASSVVTVSCDGSVMGTTTADAYGKWQYSLPSGLLNGAFNFTATATDLAGNVSKPSGLFTLSLGNGLVSVSAPVLASASDTGAVGDNLTSLLSPTLVGTATAGSVVTVYDGSTALGTTVADWKGAWSFTCPTLTQGLHSLRAQASGLLSTSSLSGALDLQIQ
jgi:hypothetical protein